MTRVALCIAARHALWRPQRRLVSFLKAALVRRGWLQVLRAWPLHLQDANRTQRVSFRAVVSSFVVFYSPYLSGHLSRTI
jgi:hypothetical protein